MDYLPLPATRLNAGSTKEPIHIENALVIFWPVAFFIMGDGATAAELGRLQGEFEALERTSIEKRCGLQFQRPTNTAEGAKARRKKAQGALVQNY